MFVVTGGAGFIGSHIVKSMNEQGITEIIVVDSIGKEDERYKNLCDLRIADYYDRAEFQKILTSNYLDKDIEAIIHQGACSNTMETDGKFMLENNFTFSKAVLQYAVSREVPMVYASSAAVYGSSTNFTEIPENERPLNLYGYSKLLFDQYVRSVSADFNSTVVGLRYFNVYGQREAHKGPMSSMVYQIYHQLKKNKLIRLFKGTQGYGDGEQRRDFVYVEDIVKVNMHFIESQKVTAIINCGTGVSRTFNDIANTIISLLGEGEIEYMEMPDSIRGKYQNFTQADISDLREFGYSQEFTCLEDGIAECVDTWNNQI